MSEITRARFAKTVEHMHDALRATGEPQDHPVLISARELIADLRKPRITHPGDIFKAEEGWQRLHFPHCVGLSSTGWRLVWEAFCNAVMGKEIPHASKSLVVSFMIKPTSDMQVEEVSELDNGAPAQQELDLSGGSAA